MRIIGIDPGYAIMGYGILDYNGNRFKTVNYGSIETKAGVPMPERLKLLYDGLTEIIQEYKPDEASIEELFFNRNVTTAIGVGEARGIAMLACVEGGLSVSEYTPMQIKQALVGYGKAEKKQVQMMVKTILNLKEVPRPDDTADAVAAAICHAHSRNSKTIGR
nr:crossover junction endodeoxyribonuclease RuvC [uncultured Mogibacterium sp.]